MPEIAQYESRKALEGLQPSGRGVEAYEEAARAIGRDAAELGATAGRAIQNIQDHDAKTDASALSVQQSTFFAGMTHNLDQAFSQADPNDATVGEKWRQDVLEPELAKFGAGMTSPGGTDAARRMTATLRQHFTEQSIAAQSAHDGAAVKTNLEQTANDLGQTAYEHPETLDATLGTFYNGLNYELSTHALTPEQEATVRSEIGGKVAKSIAVAAARGAITKNPDQFLKDMDAGKWSKYFDGEAAASLSAAAVTMKREQQADAERTVRLDRQAAEDKSKDTANNYVSHLTDPATGRVTIPANINAAVLTDPNMDFQTKQSLVGFIDRMAKQPSLHSDPEMLHDLLGRTGLAPTDPNALTQQEIFAHMGKDISVPDGKFLLAHMNAKTPQDRSERLLFNQTLAQAKSAMVTSDIMGGKTGEDNYSAFLSWFVPAYDEARKSHSAVDLLNPTSPNYILGKGGQMLHQFGASDTGLAGMLQTMSKAPPTAPQKKQPIDKFFGNLLGPK